MTRRGWVLFAALSLFWGIPYLFIKIAVTDVNPVVVAFGRTAVGGLLLLPLAIRRGALRPLRPYWRVIAVYTVAEIVVPWLLLSFAETRLNSSTTGLLVAMVPLIAAIILVARRQERFSLVRVIGLLIGFGGAIVLVGLDVHFDDAVAVLAVFLVTLGYATGPIIVSRRLHQVPALGVITVSLLGAAAVYAPFAVWTWPRHFTLRAAGSVGVLAVVCTAAAFLVMFALIAEVGPSRMTFITYINPAVAIVLGAALLHEPLTIGLAIGFPLVLIGSILGTSRSRRQRTGRPGDVAA